MSKADLTAMREPDTAAIDQAVGWLVTLWSGQAGPDDRAACERWRRADPSHEAAWQRVQALDRQVSALPAQLANPVLRSATTVSRNRRRAVLCSLGAAGAVGALAIGLRERGLWDRWTADYRIPKHASREIELADGSRVTLNTGTDVDVRFTPRERRLTLLAGEIFVATAHDPERRLRPFLVETSRGTIHALGTRFMVRESRTHTRVSVFEGAVDVVPGRGSLATRIAAGRQTSFTSEAVAVDIPLDPDAAAWTQGSLVVERMRLDKFLKELGRYRSGWVRCDPAVGGLLVSGVFPLQDTTRILTALERSLPLRIRYWGSFLVSVGPA